MISATSSSRNALCLILVGLLRLSIIHGRPQADEEDILGELQANYLRQNKIVKKKCLFSPKESTITARRAPLWMAFRDAAAPRRPAKRRRRRPLPRPSASVPPRLINRRLRYQAPYITLHRSKSTTTSPAAIKSHLAFWFF